MRCNAPMCASHKSKSISLSSRATRRLPRADRNSHPRRAGRLTLYAVAEQDNPTRVVVFEIYADLEAHRAHIETPHFKKYKADTQQMVKSLKLVDTVPVVLGAKAK